MLGYYEIASKTYVLKDLDKNRKGSAIILLAQLDLKHPEIPIIVTADFF